jgi:hypothetical protein
MASKFIAIKARLLFVVSIFVVFGCYWSTGSLNPLEAFNTGNAASRAAVIIVVWETFGLLILVGGMRMLLIKQPVQSADDIRCPGCNNLLLAYRGSHGEPTRCAHCARLWHEKCFFVDGSRELFSPCAACETAQHPTFAQRTE